MVNFSFSRKILGRLLIASWSKLAPEVLRLL